MTWVHSRSFWILAFIVALVIVGTLATSWNIVLVQQYTRMLEVGQKFARNRSPWLNIVLGSLGFLTLTGTLIMFFIKNQQEMLNNQRQRDFLAKISHELKSPLSTLELTGGLLRNKYAFDDDESRQLWKAHDMELSRLKQEVELLLESARWESTNAYEPKLQTLLLENFLAQKLAQYENALDRGIRLVRKGAPLNFKIDSDPYLLSLILNNIFDNAKKFSRDNGEIIITSSGTADNWEIALKDSGWGFDQKDCKKIFRRFHRVANNAPYSIPGTGLGLYLSKRASKKLGLKLHANSLGLGHGAEFRLGNKLS